MLGFWVFMLFSELLVPGVMTCFGTYFSKHAPGEINSGFGYRTARSMKNRDTWEFAHRYCGKVWKCAGTVLGLASAAVMLACFGKDIDVIGTWGIILWAVQAAVLIGSIFPVEAALKRTFDEHGYRRS